MKHILTVSFALTLSIQTIAQWNYKAGLFVPVPFYVPTEYTIHPSSAFFEAEYQKEKLSFTANTGYIRLKGNDLFQSIPLIFGAKYHINHVSIGAGFGPSYVTEYKDESFKILYNFKLGYTEKRWLIELNYFNWEELPDELNTLAIGVFYKLNK